MTVQGTGTAMCVMAWEAVAVRAGGCHATVEDAVMRTMNDRQTLADSPGSPQEISRFSYVGIFGWLVLDKGRGCPLSNTHVIAGHAALPYYRACFLLMQRWGKAEI